MSARFVNLDRQTPMFLPCDLREWVPADHIVHFILDAVDLIPTAHFHVNHRGTDKPPCARISNFTNPMGSTESMSKSVVAYPLW